MAWVKFFTPDSCWTWYILEGEEKDDGNWLFFVYVEGIYEEYGYVTLRELENARGQLGLKIERDIHFLCFLQNRNGQKCKQKSPLLQVRNPQKCKGPLQA